MPRCEKKCWQYVEVVDKIHKLFESPRNKKSIAQCDLLDNRWKPKSLVHGKFNVFSQIYPSNSVRTNSHDSGSNDRPLPSHIKDVKVMFLHSWSNSELLTLEEMEVMQKKRVFFQCNNINLRHHRMRGDMDNFLIVQILKMRKSLCSLIMF